MEKNPLRMGFFSILAYHENDILLVSVEEDAERVE
jgi:hypothetical protein